MSSKYNFDDVLNIFSKTNYELISTKEEYKNTQSPLYYICPIHKDKGILTTTLGHLLEGKGCKYCGHEKAALKRTKELPENKHKKMCEIRGLEYVKSGRENGKIGIYFICPKHKDLGVQFMTESNMSRNTNGKCIYCTGHNFPDWYILNKLKKEFPNTEIISGYDGKLSTRMKVLCKKHNIVHSQSLQEIFKGRGCYYCGLEKLSVNSFLSLEEYQKQVNEHSPNIEVLEYNGIEKNGIFKCQVCGHIWENNAQTMIFRDGKECPNCKLYYHGEKRIEQFLKQLDIEFKREYPFPDCKDKKPLKFDFYLPFHNICIEYDGRQHFQDLKGWADYEMTCYHDKIKNEYCKKNNIPFIRIPYWEYENLDYILFDELVKLNVIEEIK